jgi:glycosyltransferase involved in cell wall biosynthesis
MACRVPAISTDVGGVPELIENGVTGCLFPVGDVEAMAQSAISLLKDSDRLDAMGAAARQTAQDHFCASRIIPLYEKYYEQVLEQAPR